MQHHLSNEFKDLAGCLNIWNYKPFTYPNELNKWKKWENRLNKEAYNQNCEAGVNVGARQPSIITARALQTIRLLSKPQLACHTDNTRGQQIKLWPAKVAFLACFCLQTALLYMNWWQVVPIIQAQFIINNF